MRPETEQELAYTLLIELLAHQFAYPVRWIETQDVILGEAMAERVIEVGPSNILTNMMTRTWDQRFAASDQTTLLRRRFLGPQGHMPEIYYQATASIETDEESPQKPVQSTSTSDTMRQLEADSSKDDTNTLSEPTFEAFQTHSAMCSTQELSDAPLPASVIIKAIVATKLKRDPEDLNMDESIHKLVAGRSTLSNEIVGDLHAEFPGQIPERPEETPLTELNQVLETNHTGCLGKVTSNMVAKMISSKFPSYDQSRARQYLQERWGLGPMRQDAVLLQAHRRSPASRIPTIDLAERFLESMVKEYLDQEGIDLSFRQANAGSSISVATSPVEAQTLQKIGEQNLAVIQDVIKALNRHIPDQKSSVPSMGTVDDHTEDASQAAELLDIWITEHGIEYADAIKPKFDVSKQRVYESYWNWCTQDIATIVGRYQDHRIDNDALQETSIKIINRACSRSIKQLEYLISETESESSQNLNLVDLLRQLHEACIVFRDRRPTFMDTSVPSGPLNENKERAKVSPSNPLPFQLCLPVMKADKTVTQPVTLQDVFSVWRVDGGTPTLCKELSMKYTQDLEEAKQSGFTFAGRNVLITGAGKSSIGLQILRNLLLGGARITVTTSSFSTETMQMYQSLYTEYGSKGSVLRVVPFNQASQKDVHDLIQWINNDELWDLDYILPFAAYSENGRDLENIDYKSEVAHRLMLTNLLRILGTVVQGKRSKGIITRPATVVLPLSPNHGLFGNDGLYSESKIALECLLAKWVSESWSSYLSIMGVVIGWTRDTGLTNKSDTTTVALEAISVKTFSVHEMGSKIVALLGGRMNEECQSGPLKIDLGGGVDKVLNFKPRLERIRSKLKRDLDIEQAISEENLRDIALVSSPNASYGKDAVLKRLSPRANIRLQLPTLPDYDRDIANLASSLEGMVDLSRVVVIVGFSELGPHGSSRTRWEMETSGRLSLDGCIEMAWMMGLIKHHAGLRKDGSQVSGWVDVQTMQPVDEADIPARYLSKIHQHSGIRKIEPGLCDNYDPESKESLQEIVLGHDLGPVEMTLEVANNMRRKHGDKVIVTKDSFGACHVQLKAGAVVMIPRSSHFNRTVAGQIPTGWSAKLYGINDDIIDQVDPLTLFTLVCTVEAFLCAGIVDPYELYNHIHVSELGSCIGASMGGLSSLRQMHRDRYLDKPVKSDILQETFVNTIGAWVNMLLTSSSGALKTPVGACATSLESLDAGCDLIISRKAKVAIVGGVDDFVEDLSFEFGNMKATCDTDAESMAGRSADEMSRPTASSRSGFIESQGCGIQILTSAEMALKMGLPIFGVVAYTNMSADKAGRSVPAPGKGVLVNAREPSLLGISPGLMWPMLDLKHRREMLIRRRKQIAEYAQESLAVLERQMGSSACQQPGATTNEEDIQKYRKVHIDAIEEDERQQLSEAAFTLGNNFWRSNEHSHISPIRGSLATWGLGIDDISVASLHGTSTVKNDVNESFVIQEQLRHLGRKEGNLLPCVCQKWLTGHSKAAAGAWMINGCLQIMDSGIIPGNRNLDNVDGQLRSHEGLWFPSVSTDSGNNVKACSITSFGFGQKGSQAILIHPRYLYATIRKKEYGEYEARRDERWKLASRSYLEGMRDGNLVSKRIKSNPPYSLADEVTALLDPNVRFD